MADTDRRRSKAEERAYALMLAELEEQEAEQRHLQGHRTPRRPRRQGPADLRGGSAGERPLRRSVFGEAMGEIGGVRRKVHFFCMDLPQSDAPFVKAYPAEATETFLDGHVSAFAFFGGVPLSILYDNTPIAVAKICGDGKRERTRAFTELQSPASAVEATAGVRLRADLRDCSAGRGRDPARTI